VCFLPHIYNYEIKSISVDFRLFAVINFAYVHKQWRAVWGTNGSTAPGIQGKGASKERNYKN